MTDILDAVLTETRTSARLAACRSRKTQLSEVAKSSRFLGFYRTTAFGERKDSQILLPRDHSVCLSNGAPFIACSL
jgi:hypothetical protein